ncbi:MAG: DUF3347 domain-containing protein [Leeuwenhoekiella sp.]
MKKLIVLALTLTIIACGEKRSQPETVTIDMNSETAGEMDNAENEIHESADLQATFKDSTIAQVYNNYNALKTAFVNTDADAAHASAEKLDESLAGIDANTELTKAVSGLLEESEIEKQREFLPFITEEVKSLVEGNLAEGELYYQYCPMAFNGKGAYWISNEKTVRNPYFGNKMLTCGTVDAEIK